MLRGQPVHSQELCPEEEEGKKRSHTIIEMNNVRKRSRSISNVVNVVATLTLQQIQHRPSPHKFSSYAGPSSPGIRDEHPLHPATNKVFHPKWPTNLKTIVNNPPQKVPQSPPISHRCPGSQKVAHNPWGPLLTEAGE